jgi:ABC-type Fe3+/spermidine/putrescine transport system ATPase subunit
MLTVRQLTKSFGPAFALSDVSFVVETGKTLAVIGPSGSGKSTLLSIVAGLMPPDSGDVLWNDRSLRGTPTHERGFGLMFQDYALFPHLNVVDNVAFGLNGPDRERSASEMLDRVGLAGYERRDVQTLSGGEQQRVALARALAPRPRLLMLDEPLGALDRARREQLAGELRRVLQDFDQTALYVTHDQQEAFGVADSILIMQSGRVEQIGPPEEVYRSPATPFVKAFLGPGRLIEGRVERQPDGQTAVHTAIGEWPVSAEGAGALPGDAVIMLLRAEGVRKRDDLKKKASTD